jgi:hypothetical protein
VTAIAIFIASLSDEAQIVASRFPQQAFLCFDTGALPTMFKQVCLQKFKISSVLSHPRSTIPNFFLCFFSCRMMMSCLHLLCFLYTLFPRADLYAIRALVAVSARGYICVSSRFMAK